jgi:tetratricopeptide (TPR) repeat protein
LNQSRCVFRFTTRIFFSALLLVASLHFCVAQSPADNQLDLGVAAYKAARYQEAITYLQKAVDLNPHSSIARLYLGSSLAAMVATGSQSPENLKLADRAIAELTQYLQIHSNDVATMKQIAGIQYSVGRLESARDWEKKVIGLAQSDPDAPYMIGVIDWTEAHENAVKALSAAGLTDDQKGNNSAPHEVLDSLRTQNSALIDEAIKSLQRAIELQPGNTDAMAYLNLVYLRKADLDSNDPDAQQQDFKNAGDWGQKSTAAHKTQEGGK